MKKKELDLDKLIELASKPKSRKVKAPKEFPEMDKFFQECSILSGKKRIPAVIIYYRYFIWKKINLVNRKKFFNYFNSKFEKTRAGTGTVYLLSPKGFDLTPSGYFRARAFLRDIKEHEETKRKEKQKISSI